MAKYRYYEEVYNYITLIFAIVLNFPLYFFNSCINLKSWDLVVTFLILLKFRKLQIK